MLQPAGIDRRAQAPGAEGADVQRRIQPAVERLQLGVQRLAAVGTVKVQVVQFHWQVPACHRQLPVLAHLALLGQGVAQLGLPVGGKAGAVQRVDALVIGGVHVQPQHQLQPLFVGQAQAVGQPAPGTTEVAVAVGAPLHDQGFAALGRAGLP